MTVNRPKFLEVSGTSIKNHAKEIILRGANLGGWLMMEGYILHAPNIAEQVFKKNFAETLGEPALRQFEREFRRRFITENDFKFLADCGFNVLRVPFNHRLIEKEPYRYDKNGLSYLKTVVQWAGRYKLWVILDLHGACGAQNHDWHSDSLGEALLWKDKEFQKRTFALWEFLADEFKDEPAVAGYDVLNEAVIADTKILNQFYQQVIKTIRRVDKNHILFVEGNTWAIDIKSLDKFTDDNLVLSIHCYNPLEFTFNFVPHLYYPLSSNQGSYDRKVMQNFLGDYAKTAQKLKRPIFVGEFGVNYREGIYGEAHWLKDMLACFKEFDFHWTYWTYKAIKNSLFPDGILSYMPNSPWVNRPGPRMGWDTYRFLWPEKKEEIMNSWDSKNFNHNKPILDLLREAVKGA